MPLQPQSIARFWCTQLKSPDLPFLAFFDFLAFFVAKNFLAFLSVFPFFPRDFKGSEERKILAFLGGFPCFSPKSKESKIREGWDIVGLLQGSKRPLPRKPPKRV